MMTIEMTLHNLPKSFTHVPFGLRNLSDTVNSSGTITKNDYLYEGSNASSIGAIAGLCTFMIACLIIERICIRGRGDNYLFGGGMLNLQDDTEMQKKRKETIEQKLTVRQWHSKSKRKDVRRKCSDGKPKEKALTDVENDVEPKQTVLEEVGKKEIEEDKSKTSASTHNTDQAAVDTRTAERDAKAFPENDTLRIECAICLCNFENDQLICESNNTICRHRFHEKCMSNWLLAHDECPVCRCSYLESNTK